MLLAGSLSHAAVIERDWLAPGDGLLTYDTVNQREWLDLTESMIVDLPVGYFNALVAGTDPEGLFEGFSVAQSDDVVALAESAGIDTGAFDYAVNGAAAENMVALVGATSSSGSWARGYLEHNPIDSLEIPGAVSRETYISPEEFSIDPRIVNEPTPPLAA